jgi:uncharacterized membrane protein AbrB (regulator of aidB expression)
MAMNLSNMLKGLGGEFEINRVVGALGSVVYIVGAHGFVGWNMWHGEKFNLTEYCIAFPGGLAVCVGAIAGAVALKDRQVATAQIIRDTGAVPTAPPAGPPVPTEPPQ